jgi:hypothetical protein
MLLVREQDTVFGRTNSFFTFMFVNFGRTKEEKKGTKAVLSHVCKKGMSLREFHSLRPELSHGRHFVTIFG